MLVVYEYDHGGRVPPSGGSLEIGNGFRKVEVLEDIVRVPPSGGSLEIGNISCIFSCIFHTINLFPLRGDP